MTQKASLSSDNPPPQTQPSSHTQNPHISLPAFHKIFAAPSWSVRTLLPSDSSPSSACPAPDTTITSATLHHLLRLSSLPAPSSPAEETTLLQTLHTQLHFVRAIQAVDTAGVSPLTSIRKETAAAAPVITLDALKDALAGETIVGFRRRPRRVRGGQADTLRERGEQEVLVEEKTRERRERGYYVVESGRIKGAE